MSRQIVITLPEWTEIKQIDNKQLADLLPAYDEMLNMIKNGTPLPKGHGRLIDKDALIGKIHGVKSITAVLDAKTIIEADRSDEE